LKEIRNFCKHPVQLTPR